MADDRLRDLERRWRQAGTPEAEASFLGERLRCGELEPERVELAAVAGHPAARAALGWTAPEGDVVSCLEALAERDPDCVIDVRLAVAAEFAARWTEGTGEATLEELVQAAGAFAERPRPRERRGLQQAMQRAVAALELDAISRLPQRQARAMLQVVLGTACALAGVRYRSLDLPLGFTSKSPAMRNEDYGGLLGFVEASLRVVEEPELRGVIAAAVAARLLHGPPRTGP